MKGISVVIPNYNGRELLKNNLPSVFKALDYAKIKDYEIIVSDDCSTDDSLAFLHNEYPTIITIESNRNAGFSKNINQGILKATKDLILILNSDMNLSEDYIKWCIPYFDAKDTFGVMGSVNENGQKIYKLGMTGLQTYRGKLEVNSSASNFPLLLMSGGNSLLDREKLLILEGFDENFSPFYGEDDDLGIRSCRMGWNYYFEGRAKCTHEESSTINTYNRRNQIKIISKKNKLYLYFIHLSIPRLILFFAIQSFKLATYWLVGKFWFYSSFKMFIKLLPEAKVRRTSLKALPKSFEQVVSDLVTQELNFLNQN